MRFLSDLIFISGIADMVLLSVVNNWMPSLSQNLSKTLLNSVPLSFQTFSGCLDFINFLNASTQSLAYFFSLVERASSVKQHQQKPANNWILCSILPLYPCTLNEPTRFCLLCMKQIWVSGKLFWSVWISCKSFSIEVSAKLILEIDRSVLSNLLLLPFV